MIAAFERVAHALDDDARLALFDSLPAELQDAVYRALADECAERRELERLEREDVERRRPRVGRRWQQPRLDARRVRTAGGDGPDPLLAIPPAVYVELLTGCEVARSGMIRCPLPDHDDRWPSCMVYDEPERGFYCFGCLAGGTIYDFGAALWGFGTRGEDFKELRRRLAYVLAGREAA